MDPKPWLARAVLPVSVAAVILTAGCLTTTWSVRVVQMVPVDKPRQRIYVIVHEGEAPSRYAKQLAQEMSSALGRHLTCRSAILTGVEFDSRPVDDDMVAFQPEAVLVIKPLTARPPVRYGINAIYGFTLLDQPSNRTVWSAKAEPHEYPGSADEVANDIVATLVASRMIPPEQEQSAANRRATGRTRPD